MPRSPDAFVIQTYEQAVGARRRAGEGRVDQWPHRLDLRILSRPGRAADPWGGGRDYPKEFLSLDLDELARDVDAVLTTSQGWWPADYGHYGPLVLRMVWHFAGTYRVGDGRGGASAGMQRFAPLDSWPDNRNLDKARRLLWPVKQKYGRKISWPDLIVFAGNRALESMGFTTFGFAGGRDEVWEADETYWGPEASWFSDERHSGVRDLDDPLAASEMGLIYVNPQGPGTVPDPIAAGRDIRQTFRRMGFTDDETVALIAGGHTFGKSHGAVDPADCLGPDPEAAPLEAQGLGWANRHGAGKGPDTVTSGLDGTWTSTPTTWDNGYFQTLFAYHWQVELSPAGLWQWVPRDGGGAGTVPDPFDPARTHHPTMLTTDLSLQEDPIYEPIARRFLENPDQLADAFARAWFKLTHIDMGPIQRYLGPLVPAEPLIWQDRVPEVDHGLVDVDDIAALKGQILGSRLSVAQLVTTAWASASTFRNSDKRGGANGARIRLEPQRSWEVNEPEALAAVLAALERIRDGFNDAQRGDKAISLADLIVLGGCTAIEQAAAGAGRDLEVPFRPGRTDATQEWTDVEWFAALEPTADGFRNYVGKGNRLPPEVLMVDRAGQLTLSAREMAALLGGLRVLGANHGASPLGVFTMTPGVLSNDFFFRVLDVDTEWVPRTTEAGVVTTYEGRYRHTGEVRWAASRVDLAFLTDPALRALSEIYASKDGDDTFVHDFVAAWHKVMELDLFDRA
ncbi:MAG TPA: catalase/peroxidase HPI [Marmoricola sp.]